MTTEGRAAPPIPTTLDEWEVILSQALLCADDGDTDAIRSFEITPETLAMHCGLGPEHAGAAEAAFKAALQHTSYLNWCLQHGTYKVPGKQQPNCLAILASTLLVDSLLDGVYESKGQYRAKLAEWLNPTESYSDLRGIAKMWEQLVAWLNGRIADGAPFKRLVLPEIPVTWTHIGYTRYLSFPTKRDLRLLTTQIGRSPSAGIDPTALVIQLDPLIRKSSVSHGMKIAFDDFRTALRSGAASVDHRFWRLVTRAREQCGHAAPRPATLVMNFDEDGQRSYLVADASGERTSSPALLGSAIASSVLNESLNLGPAIRRGILFFRSTGLASWSATGEPPPGNGPFHVGIASKHARLAGGAIVDFVQSGSWFVSSQPVSINTVNDILRRIGIRDAKQTVRTIGLVDGIHVGPAWLGQPRYLPFLEGASSDVVVQQIDGDGSGGLIWANGDLRSDAPVDGQFLLSDASSHWSRRATFTSLAEVHQATEYAAYSTPVQAEWLQTNSQALDRVPAVDLDWDEAPNPNQDVIEALYASSRSGTGEGEAAEIIDRAVGRRGWDMLRTLQEASFFDARPRERWRGRTFTLRHPELSVVRVGAEDIAIVSGAIPARLEFDFRTTVELRGGRAFRRFDEQGLAPPLLAAMGIEAEEIAKALGWTVCGTAPLPDGRPDRCLIETRVSGDGYIASSFWDWSLGRFRVGVGDAGSVTLERLVHPGGRDHDVYRVFGKKTRSFHSRHAAIIDAHIQAGKPLFRYDDGQITRIPIEGALPLEIAAALRLRTLRNGGATLTSWRYAASPEDAAWLAGLLPGIIEGVSQVKPAGAAMAWRRGRGSRRPTWSSGGIAA